MRTTAEIRKHLNFCTQYQLGVVSYCIDGKEAGDAWKRILIHFNAKNTEAAFPLPEGKYMIVANNGEIEEEGIGELVIDEVSVAAISMMILIEIQSSDVSCIA